MSAFDDSFKKAVRATRATRHAIKPGMRFRWVYADSNPEWVVVRRRSGDVWVARVVEGEDDYAGVEQVFTAAQISSAMKHASDYQKRSDDMAAWYASLRLGQVVHYNNGFGNFVRSKVVAGPGRNVLQAVALVGAWREHDLVPHGHYVKMIVEHTTFNPNWTSIYESPAYSSTYRGSPDPRKLEPLPLPGKRS